MDDVLDCLCIFHLHRNIHGHIYLLATVLLRGEGGPGVLAPLAGHKGQFDFVSQIRASYVDAPRTGGTRELECIYRSLSTS